MIIDDSVLFNKIMELQANRIKPHVNYDYVAEFESEGKLWEIYNVESITYVKDYVKEQSDNIMLTVQVRRSTHRRLLTLNPKTLNVILTKRVNNNQGTLNDPANKSVTKYKAFLTDRDNKDVASNAVDRWDSKGDLVDFVTLHLHLVNESIYEFRLLELGGVYRGPSSKSITLHELLRSFFTIQLPITGTKLHASVIAPDNKEYYKQVVIKNGTKVIDTPDYLHDKYGLYGNGLGVYLDREMWHIFPVSNYNRFDKSLKTLTILKIPTQEMVHPEDTFLLDGDRVFIFATGGGDHTDLSDRGLQQVGNGIRFVKAGNILDTFRDHSKGVTTIPSTNVVHVKFDDRPGDLDVINTHASTFSSNPWKGLSEVTANIGSIITVVWENANPDLLYPGMPIKYMFKQNGKVITLNGTLIYATYKVLSRTGNATDRVYKTTGSLILRCENTGLDTNAMQLD